MKSQITKDREAAERKERFASISKALKNVFTFTIKATGTLFALAIAGLGAYALYISSDYTGLRYIAFTVSGVCAVVDGIGTLYYVLMKLGSK